MSSIAAIPTSHGDPGPPEPPDLSTVWLRVFLEVARHGSFTVAARTLGWTQSAVSRQISSLESALGGGPLFDRLPRGVRLTEAGRALVPHAEAAAHGPVRLARLADADWIAGSSRPEGTLLDAAARLGFRPRVAHVVAEWTAKQGYVAAGLGVTLVPALAAASVRPDVVLLPVHAEDAPPRAVYAATVRGRTLATAARAFVTALREAAERIPG
ncbi:LysR substrate binding domain-containing protein [Streptomyces puniciscabiei]|uniref:LysR substrate binding domain-containing protein n=1 Tax=Streptomyces puniciscabiei TaxID=164348 RepID=A0A542UK10_9ACTN|nr:LysR family transcriptional regulator [Streptomyces puniciscabiei]TQK99412.1 LysR substrate binding domain-containing protein [Streptomyces puniciscabiei]